MHPPKLVAGLLTGLLVLVGASASASSTPKAQRPYAMVSQPVVVVRHLRGVTSFVVAYELNRVDDTHIDIEGRSDRGATVDVQTSDGQATYRSGQAPFYLRSPTSRCYYAAVPASTPPVPALAELRSGDLVRVRVTDRKGHRYGGTARVISDRHRHATPDALSARLDCRNRYRTERDRGQPTLDPNSPACDPTKDGFPARCAYQY